MQTHYLQHVPFEGLGSIEQWLQKAAYTISSTQFFKAHTLPDVDEFDLLIILGGPMSVNDEHSYPWLRMEKEFIKSTIAAGKPVLGICLGAQLIASAMGSDVSQGSTKEIGWFPIQAVNLENASVFHFPEETDVFHWHGETFKLPNGATRIAKSKACENQAFQIGHNVIGLQFHLETTPLSARAIVKNCKDELIEGDYIESADSILSTPPQRFVAINSLMTSVLEFLHASRSLRNTITE